MSKRVLVIDCETKPSVVYAFNAYDVNVQPEQVIKSGGIICFAAQWVGEKEIMFYSDWDDGHYGMLRAAHKLLSEADAVVGYNSMKFDIPKFRGEFILAGLEDIPPLTQIDVYKTVKQFGLYINKLAFIGPLFELGAKIKHEGFSLWRGVMEGDAKCQKRMKKYCIGDVKLTTRLYLHVKGFIRNHPHLGDDRSECGNCGSKHTQHRGFSRTKYFKTQRLQCVQCGSWSTGARTAIKKEVGDGIVDH
jgi:hypothetical protein